MTPFLQLALSLAVIVAAAKLGGYLCLRLGQPSVLGELLVGIILGPSVFDFLHLAIFTDTRLAEIIHELAEIGVLMLMFLAGLDLHLKDLAKAGKIAGLAGALGVLFPLVLGAGAGLLMGLNTISAIFIGLTLAATSVSISAQTLMELGAIRSRVGVGLLGAAILDDVLVILGMSVFSVLVKPDSGGGVGAVLLLIFGMVVYLVVASALGWWLLPKVARVVQKMPISQGLMAFVFVTILAYGWFAEVGGNMAAITGAFLAGLWLGRTPYKERIEAGMSTIAYSIFVPIFFINIGLSANARELSADSLVLLGLLLVVAVLGKVLGAGWGGMMGGLTRLEALQLGVGMMSRGEVGLIVASVGVAEGLITPSGFAVVVGIVIITTILTPIALRFLFRNQPKPVVSSLGGGTS
jgi:Kef-type K+ transport system membrane component KefB